MTLTDKEKQVKALMEGSFVPALHKVLSNANPKEYQRWNGNACRQTAILGVQLLRQFLPNYEWTVWDGDFSDILEGRKVKYNHAWVHGVDKQAKKGLLVDLSRNHHERLFIEVSENKYPRNNPTYKHMRLINKIRIDDLKEMQDLEYFTALPSMQVLAQVIIEMQK